MRASVVRPCGIFLVRAIGPGVPRAVAETVRGIVVCILDSAFPEFVWTGFGEQVSENEFNEDADMVSPAHLGLLLDMLRARPT